MSKIASKIPSKAMLVNITRRLDRFLECLLTKAGQSVWLGQRQLTQLHAYSVNALAH